MRGVGPADVEEERVHRVLGARSDDALLVFVARAGLDAREEARPQRHRLSAERESCGDAAAVGDAAGGDHGERAHRLDDRRQQHRDRGLAANVPSGFEALGHHREGALRRGSLRFLRGRDLQDHLRSAALRFREVRRGVAPEEDHDRYLLLEAGLELATLEKRQQQVHAERAIGERARRMHRLSDGRRRQAAHAEDAEAAGVRDRRGELGARVSASHSGVEDRQLDPESATERRDQHAPRLVPVR
jgi:hypothetical protein